MNHTGKLEIMLTVTHDVEADSKEEFDAAVQKYIDGVEFRFPNKNNCHVTYTVKEDVSLSDEELIAAALCFYADREGNAGFVPDCYKCVLDDEMNECVVKRCNLNIPLLLAKRLGELSPQKCSSGGKEVGHEEDENKKLIEIARRCVDSGDCHECPHEADPCCMDLLITELSDRLENMETEMNTLRRKNKSK